MIRSYGHVMCWLMIVGAMTMVGSQVGGWSAAGSDVQAQAQTRTPPPGEPRRPWIVAHRGASAYAPENTIPALRLAADQGATYVEYDLQPTKDGVLVLLHDETLERTTDVEQIYPERFREVKNASGSTVRRWYVDDFTFAELQKLDAGTWFNEKFKGTRIPSHAEAIDAMRGRCGLFIELKAPVKYAAKGFDVEGTTLADLKKAGLDQPGADPKTPVLIQSFDAPSVEKLALTLKTKLPLHFLFGKRDQAQWTSPAALKKVRTFSTGISPEKLVLLENPKVAELARAAGLAVTPYTFRASAVQGYSSVTDEMAHYMKTFALDGVITDNPDLAPKQTVK